MFFGGALVSIPAPFKLCRLTVDHQNSAVGLGSASDHVGDKVAMARRIKDSEAAVLRVEVFSSYFNGNSSLTLLFGLVHNIRKLEPWLFELFAHLLVLPEVLLVDLSHLEK